MMGTVTASHATHGQQVQISQSPGWDSLPDLTPRLLRRLCQADALLHRRLTRPNR
jgi:hypothetical protein